MRGWIEVESIQVRLDCKWTQWRPSFWKAAAARVSRYVPLLLLLTVAASVLVSEQASCPPSLHHA